MRSSRRPWSGVASILTFAILAVTAFVPRVLADEEGAPDPLANLEFRNIGPVNMSGRVGDVEGVPGDPRTVYVGSASGGVWRTTNGGVTFEPIFDDQPIASIGDIALAPSNPGVVYVGSGEGNPRNSVSFGNGVYKSTDGGDTWTHLGLEKTRHITRIVVDGLDPDHVCVGALGNIFGPNEERGVFCSWDGGATWEKTLYIDDQHGVSDMDIDPSNPNIVYAAMWRFERKPWTHWSGSEDGGVYRSVDGGRTWKRLEQGLPKLLGRIGVKVAPGKPKVVYVIAESNDGVLFRSDDRGNEFRKVSDDVQIVSRGLYYTDMRVSPADEDEVFAVASRLFRSKDGGKTFERISRSTHVDYHSLWIDPEDPDRIWQGQDGGVAVSYDGGKTWDPIRNLPLAQFYQVFTDNREPFYVVGGGLQDNGTWYGPSRTRDGAILADHWWMMSFGDAYFVVPHADIPDLYLSEYQGGGIMRTNTRTGQQVEVNPQSRRNDGGPVGELDYRFNWNAPIVQSPHNDSTVYFAGNVVFRTTDFGDTWEPISPDLTTNDPEKQKEAGGPVWYENTTAEYHCTIISFAESPVEAGVLWSGSDDGKVHVSRDAGATWNDVTGNLRGVPEFSPVSHIEPSTTAGGTAYATFDRHMFADFAPHVYRTTDFGMTWRRLPTTGLPDEGWIWVLKEDPENSDLLYAGTEVGLYASWDAGSSWQRLHLGNLPTVAIHDLQVHPKANDLVLGTHGRAIWILDDLTPVQQLGEIEGKAVHLFPVRPALRFARTFTRYGLGDRQFRGPNPPYGAAITYYLAETLEEPEVGQEEADGDGTAAEGSSDEVTEPEPRLKLEILDRSGEEVIREIEKPGLKAGINRVYWDLTGAPPRTRVDREGEADEFFGGPDGPAMPPGTYTARLTVDGEVVEQSVEVRLDPLLEVSNRDLRAQYEMASRLRDLQSVANDAMRRLDVVKDEIAARKASIERLKLEVPSEITGAKKETKDGLIELLEQLTRPEGKTFWSQSPRLSDQLGSLFGNVNGSHAAPTAAHQAYFEELEAKCNEAFTAINVFFAETIPALNAQLAEQSLPALSVPVPLEWEVTEDDL
jgi:photosystem II stability/assembly factor-like uncharacterized protein